MLSAPLFEKIKDNHIEADIMIAAWFPFSMAYFAIWDYCTGVNLRYSCNHLMFGGAGVLHKYFSCYKLSHFNRLLLKVVATFEASFEDNLEGDEGIKLMKALNTVYIYKHRYYVI